MILVWMLCLSSSGPALVRAQQNSGASPRDNVVTHRVTIWSEGVRIAGDIIHPKEMNASDPLPAIVMSHGWGGTRASLTRDYAPVFASAGFVVLTIDYRGWGESDSKLVIEGEMPEPDENGMVTVRARALRTVVDPYDQIQDIVHAIDFIVGEPGVDPERIGYWGTSYSGAHAVWVAAHEPRIKCAVGQVSAADSLDLVQTAYKEMDIAERANREAIQRARGEIDPVPQGPERAPGLRGWPWLSKVVTYRPVQDAGLIKIPILLIDAENEELFDRHKGAELAIERAKASSPAAEYVVIEGITHYGIYRAKREEGNRLALDWFEQHLKPPTESRESP